MAFFFCEFVRHKLKQSLRCKICIENVLYSQKYSLQVKQIVEGPFCSSGYWKGTIDLFYQILVTLLCFHCKFSPVERDAEFNTFMIKMKLLLELQRRPRHQCRTC